MRPLFLYGNHELTIDEKNRLLIPSELRRIIDPERDGEAFILVVGRNGKPWLYPERYYENLATQAPAELAPAEDQLERDLDMFGDATRLEWDKQGRVLISEKTLKPMGIGREVTLVGVRDHLQIWNRSDWVARRASRTGQQG